MRAGEDGPGDGEVRHREASGGAFAFLSLLTRGEDVVAVHETGDEPHQDVTARDLLEDGRGVVAVEIDADIAERDGGSDIDAHQDVTPGDNVVSGRERGDGEVVVALLVVFLEQTEFRLVRVGRGWRDQASEARPDGEQYGDGSNAGPHMPPLCCAIEMSMARDGDLPVPSFAGFSARSLAKRNAVVPAWQEARPPPGSTERAGRVEWGLEAGTGDRSPRTGNTSAGCGFP